MGRKRISDYVDFNQMPPGRHVFGLTGARTVVDELSIDALVPPLDAATSEARRALEVELAWSMAKSRPGARGDAPRVKNAIARQLTSIHSLLEARSVGDEGDPVIEQAEALLEMAFPSGVLSIIQQPYEVLLGTLDTVGAAFEGRYAAHVEAVGAGREVSRLKRLTDALREELQPGPEPAVDYEDVLTARDALHEAVCRVIVAVVDHFADAADADEGVRARERILAELNRQQELVTEAYRRHRQPLDVDPETGEELEPVVNVTTERGGDTDTDGEDTDGEDTDRA